jgi:hypothetical protein
VLIQLVLLDAKQKKKKNTHIYTLFNFTIIRIISIIYIRKKAYTPFLIFQQRLFYTKLTKKTSFWILLLLEVITIDIKTTSMHSFFFIFIFSFMKHQKLYQKIRQKKKTSFIIVSFAFSHLFFLCRSDKKKKIIVWFFFTLFLIK